MREGEGECVSEVGDEGERERGRGSRRESVCNVSEKKVGV